MKSVFVTTRGSLRSFSVAQTRGWKTVEMLATILEPEGASDLDFGSLWVAWSKESSKMDRSGQGILRKNFLQ